MTYPYVTFAIAERDRVIQEQKHRIEELEVEVREWEKSYGSLEHLGKLQRERIEELESEHTRLRVRDARADELERTRLRIKALETEKDRLFNSLTGELGRNEKLEAVAEAARNYREEFAKRGIQTAESMTAWNRMREALARLDAKEK